MAGHEQLTCPVEICLAERGNGTSVQFFWLLADRPELAPLVDLRFAWIVAIARRGNRSPRQSQARRTSAPEPHRKIYEAHFRCPVRFAARQNVLVFNKTVIDQPFLTHNADLLAMVDAPTRGGVLTQQLAQKSVSEKVKGILKRIENAGGKRSSRRACAG